MKNYEYQPGHPQVKTSRDVEKTDFSIFKYFLSKTCAKYCMKISSQNLKYVQSIARKSERPEVRIGARQSRQQQPLQLNLHGTNNKTFLNKFGQKIF